MEEQIGGGGPYGLDTAGFLADGAGWDEAFPARIARSLGIAGGLTEEHWRVIRFIRGSFESTGRCPLVHETCRSCGLFLRDLKRLFPTGYLRGACKAAGLTYREADLATAFLQLGGERGGKDLRRNKTYRVDVLGFLADPSEWDELFAVRLARDLKMEGDLREAHWRVIRFLRDAHQAAGEVPTIYETCEALGLNLASLSELFPDGYHRGAVRMAGLRAR